MLRLVAFTAPLNELGPHRDHRIEQSRVNGNALSPDLDRWLEPSFFHSPHELGIPTVPAPSSAPVYRASCQTLSFHLSTHRSVP